MSLTQIIVLHWLAIIALLLTIAYLYNRVQYWKKPVRRHIVINSVEPVKVSFTNEFEPVDAHRYGLSQDEAAWQRRRTIAGNFTDYIFAELMQPDSPYLEISESHPPYAKYPTRVTASMFLVPLKK